MTGAHPSSASRALLKLLSISQTNPLDIPLPFWYNTPMKFIVVRYHAAPVTFSSLQAAEDFAQGCGDFQNLLEVGA